MHQKKTQKTPDFFIIHVPFSEEEHKKVIEYLSIVKLINFDIPFHHLPFQLQITLKNRSINSIMNYIGELIYRKSSSFDSEAKDIRLYKPKEMKIIIETNYISYKSLKMNLNRLNKIFLGFKYIFNQTFILFFENEYPIIYDINSKFEKILFHEEKDLKRLI